MGRIGEEIRKDLSRYSEIKEPLHHPPQNNRVCVRPLPGARCVRVDILLRITVFTRNHYLCIRTYLKYDFLALWIVCDPLADLITQVAFPIVNNKGMINPRQKRAVSEVLDRKKHAAGEHRSFLDFPGALADRRSPGSGQTRHRTPFP